MTKIIEFTSIQELTMRKAKQQIKVIDNFYPLIGNVIVDPVDSLKLLKSKPNTI